MEYVSRFLSLRCAGDVLNAVPRMRQAEKEITESMGILKHIKGIALGEKMKYTLVDLCAGNALTSVLGVHVLPLKHAIAVDRQKRHGNYGIVKRFDYIQADIKELSYPEDSIIISVHPCKSANLIVDIFNTTGIKHLVMMPCCNDTFADVIGWPWLCEEKGLSKYDLWTLHLAQSIKNAEVRIVTDYNVISPKNNIIIARRNA